MIRYNREILSVNEFLDTSKAEKRGHSIDDFEKCESTVSKNKNLASLRGAEKESN